MRNLETRTQAIKGDLLGRRVRIKVPYERGEVAIVGTVTGVGYPLVQIDTGGGAKQLRHADQLTLLDQ